MQTTLQQVNPVELDLEIYATAEDLNPRLDKALRSQRSKTAIKGFRPGKVPLQLVKKLYGEALGLEIADSMIQEAIRAETAELKLFGPVRITAFEYKPDGDLRAVVRLSVRPEFEITDLSAHTLDRLVHVPDDEEIDGYIENMRRKAADLAPIEEGADENDLVLFDAQALDAATGAPVIGERHENVSIYVGHPGTEEAWSEALKGHAAGETFRVEITHDEPHDDEEPASDLLLLPGDEARHTHHAHTHHYEVTVKEVKRPVLPDLEDSEFIDVITEKEGLGDRDLREFVREKMQKEWQHHSRERLRSDIVDKMIELHPVEVPEAAVEVILDQYVKEFRERYKERVPPDFDEGLYRAESRERAEGQARWMIIRDKVIETENLQVSTDDMMDYLENLSGNSYSPDFYRQLLKAAPSLADDFEYRILSDKVLDVLAERFQLADKSLEQFQTEEESGEEAAEAGVEVGPDESEPTDAGEASSGR